MITWPSSLVREIAARRCAFFLGAGVSASAVDESGQHPKGWSQFLDEATQLVTDKTKKRIVRKLINEKKYLLALQGIKDEVDLAEYRDLLDKNFNKSTFIPGALHKTIYDLDSRIIITTNFDKIYEQYCMSLMPSTAFKVIEYNSEDLIDEIRSDTRLIIKAHGSIDNISKMLFTRSEYHKARVEHRGFYEVVKAVFLTHTIVFIGCGMEDPDVLLLLEDVQITGSSQRPHYALIRRKDQNLVTMQDWKKTYNISALEYGPSHDNLIECLLKLVDLVENERAILGYHT